MPAIAQDRTVLSESAPKPAAHGSGFWTLALGSLGVVYGDIGTSPLYALKESLSAAASGGAPTREMVFGVVSLILWALIVIVSVKYVLFILRADNNGEGGTLTLMALAQRALGHNVFVIGLLGMIGAALFYGDAIITPAISVLSAVEGLNLATPAFEHYVLPLSLAILVGLFAVQSRGTARVAAWFGPIMVLWFALLALGGLRHIADQPGIVAALSPTYGIAFLATHGTAGLFALGAVFLAVTGAEALYADLGHFGRRPIQLAWLFFVLPSLGLNYLGQGAMLLLSPDAIENPFFLLYPDWALLPMVGMATVATIIASQAVITGAFSLTQQAIQLGLLPRMDIRWTSETERGQIYVPRVNWLLLAAVIFLVVSFKTSSALSHAYGLAVTGTMVVTAVMAFFVVRYFWRWSLWASVAVIAPFLLVDTIFLAANALKIPQGGWMPLVVGAGLVVVMWTWRRGTRILFEKTRKIDVPLAELVAMLRKSHPHRVRGTAVFLTSDPETAPAALLHNLKHNKVLHEQNVILTVVIQDAPRLDDEGRVTIEPIGESFFRATMACGYMETPDIPRALALLRRQGFKFDIMATSFFVSRRSLRPSAHGGMPLWQDKLFIGLAKSASDATDFFRIPTGRVVEVGTQVTV
ncbi:potassium transporter Kup [Microvirga thermotolerans]|uniref:Probable potassium transport system protein Kup n=1 Tax=Microvirga thermotolerans TaxID=2651334 RepID=A0A5P9JS46_9HYPH|nr:potassium transporter Kup [Microvirga thermotolerans]QFU14899.1 potassium transporter Kup [Microvirga thermotolerans]